MAERVTQQFVQVLVEGLPKARVTQQFAQVLVSVNGSAYAESASNTLALSQSATYQFGLAPQSTSNTLSLTQQVSAGAVLNLSCSNTLTLDSDVAKTTTLHTDNTITLSHDVTYLKRRAVTVTTPITLTSALTVVADFVRTVAQGISLTQSVARTVRRNIEVIQVLVFSQTASGVATKKASNSLSLSQTATALVVKHSRHTLSITSIASVVKTVGKTTANGLIPFQTVSVSFTKTVAVPQTLTLVQVAVGAAVRSVSNTLVLSQSAVGVSAKPAFSTLVLTHEVTLTRGINKSVGQAISITSVADADLIISLTASNVLALAQSATKQKRAVGSASNSLTLSQELIQERKAEQVTDVLDLTSDVDVSKLSTRLVTSNLTLVQSVQVGQTLVRSIQHIIVFQGFFQKYAGLQGQTYISVPSTQVVKVRRIVRLQSDSQVIILPTPEFNDRDIGLNEINIKRAMDGTRRVYKREVTTRKLVYDFILDRVKAIELRAFILANNSTPLEMENWKGEIWYINLTNNPFTFTEVSRWGSVNGNKVSVSLEMEGVRIA